MQIAQCIGMPASANVASDVVAPGRLFAVARLRLQGAASTIRTDASGEAPTSLAASIAINQANSGINTLRSILVPTTSFDQRRRAAVAIDHAEQGLRALRSYREAMLEFGDQAKPIDALHPRLRVLLTEAIDRFDGAAARSTPHAPLPG